MRKKICFLLALCLLMTLACACGSKKEEAPAVNENTFVINELEFELDREVSFKDLKYTVTGDFKEAEHDEFIPYVQYSFAQEDGSNLLFFRIFYYQDKAFIAAMQDLGIEEDVKLTEGKTGDISYGKYPQPRDDGGTMDFYFIHKGADTYVLNFVSRYDISDFETKVIDSLSF